MKDEKVCSLVYVVVFRDGTPLKKNGKVVAFTVKSHAESALLHYGADHLISF